MSIILRIFLIFFVFSNNSVVAMDQVNFHREVPVIYDERDQMYQLVEITEIKRLADLILNRANEGLKDFRVSFYSASKLRVDMTKINNVLVLQKEFFGAVGKLDLYEEPSELDKIIVMKNNCDKIRNLDALDEISEDPWCEIKKKQLIPFYMPLAMKPCIPLVNFSALRNNETTENKAIERLNCHRENFGKMQPSQKAKPNNKT